LASCPSCRASPCTPCRAHPVSWLRDAAEVC
jgi:hypothetical protein